MAGILGVALAAAVGLPAKAQSPSPESLFAQATMRSTTSKPVRSQPVGSPSTSPQHRGRGGQEFLSRHEDGWFWYEDPPAPQKKPKPNPMPTPAEPQAPKDQPLSVEWIRNNIDRLRDQAINDPTKENVEMFLYVHKYMMDLSERFAYTYRAVAESNTALDETVANPVTGVARRQISDATEAAQDQIINQLAGKVGIWYFFQSTCPYCMKQNPILDFLLQDAPLSILAISLDGLPMADGSHPNWVVDTGQAEQLQVSTTPTLFLVKPDTKEVVLLAAGLRALPEIKQRIVEVAYHQKWISKTDYETAMHGLPRRLLTDGMQMEQAKPGASDRELLEILRKSGVHGGSQQQHKNNNEGGNSPWRSN